MPGRRVMWDQPNFLKAIFGSLIGLWIVSHILAFYDVFEKPYGWLVLPVLAAWAWYRLRQIR